MSASFPESGHANLSALQVIGSSVASLLGPVKGIKCLFDEDSSEGSLVTSTNELLQDLDIEHPVGQLAREFCLSQHKRHGSSCTTLVTLAGLWSANVQFLLKQDVPIQDILRVGDEFLQDCEDIAEQCTISIHSLPKPATASATSDPDRNGIMLDVSSTSHKVPCGHRDIVTSEVTGMDGVLLNQNSNNSCTVPSRTTLKSTTRTGSSGHENGKCSSISDFESTFSPMQKHAIPSPSVSSDKFNTSSAIPKDDLDDVSWFFENDCQYDVGTKDVNSTTVGTLDSSLQRPSIPFLSAGCAKPDTSSAMIKDDDDVDDDNVGWFFESDSQCGNRGKDISTAGKLSLKLEVLSLHGHQQNDFSYSEKLMMEEEEDIDDVEWFFEENDEVKGMHAHSCDALLGNAQDFGKSNASSLLEKKGKDVCLEATIPKENVQQRAKTRETTLKPLYGLPPLKSDQHSEEKDKQVITKGVHSVVEQRLQVLSSQERSSTKVSPIQRSVQFESLLKSVIEQKPSKLLRGSRRILSRHLLEDEQETSGLTGASDVPLPETKPEQTSSDFDQHRLKDEKASVVPNLTLGSTTSDHFVHQNDVQSGRVHKQNVHVDVLQMLADDGIKTPDLTRKAERLHTITELGGSLCHGADAEMKLAIQACQSQLIASQEQCHRFVFRPKLVHIQTLAGPPASSSCCVHGLVLPCHEDQLNTIHTITGRSMTCLLLNGELKESYKHRGFKDSLRSANAVSDVPPSTTAIVSAWTDRVLSILKKLNVNLLMVRGSVDSSLVDACSFHNILILDNVPYRLLQLLVTVYKSNLLTYITDALQADVCENIQVFYWSCGYDPHPTVRSRDLKLQHHIRIVCPGDVMTIVLCAPSAPHHAGSEQRLLSCMARLGGALHDGKVLPGGGRIEKHLVEKLSQQNGYRVTNLCHYHHGLIYEALAQGLAAYIQHTHVNMGQQWAMAEDRSPDTTGCHGSPSCNVYDCFSAKKGAWQKAWLLVKQVLLCDALIITGVDKGDRHLDRVL